MEATHLHGNGVPETPQPLPVSTTPQVSVGSSAPPAQLMNRDCGVLVSRSWAALSFGAWVVHTIVVLAGADTTLETPAWAKTRSCRSPVSRARGRAACDC